MSKLTKKLIVCVVLIGVVCILVFLIGLKPSENTNPVTNSSELEQDTTITNDSEEIGDNFEVVVPWEEENAKQPQDYSKDEYLQLSQPQKDKFVESFENEEDLRDWEEKEEIKVERYPWQTGGKQPIDYTLDEYNALNQEQKMAFQRYFGNETAFLDWLDKAESNDAVTKNPWEAGGKQPNEYTYKEFTALTGSQQLAFQNWFSSIEEFNLWLEKAQKNESLEETMPWETGGKQPSEYTYDEFAALTGSQQIAFQKSFQNEEEFQKWLNKAQNSIAPTPTPESEKNPWETGGKQPSEYTYDEYAALTGSQQMAFQNWFGSIEGFDAWLTEAQKDDTNHVEKPWETGGKQPSEYTYDEYAALTGSQQMAFQNWFGSIEGFDAWLTEAQKDDTNHVEKPWEIGGKQPSEYTYDEYAALTGSQQMAFQNWFGSIEGFDAWLTEAQKDAVNNVDLPWKNGGKLPEEYTWEEFEALSGAQQIAFQNYFANFEDFEAWMNNAIVD